WIFAKESDPRILLILLRLAFAYATVRAWRLTGVIRSCGSGRNNDVVWPLGACPKIRVPVEKQQPRGHYHTECSLRVTGLLHLHCRAKLVCEGNLDRLLRGRHSLGGGSLRCRREEGGK